jgi:hypothetical protein
MGRKFPTPDRSKKNTVTLEADGPWTMTWTGQGTASGNSVSGGAGTIVLTFEMSPSADNRLKSSLASAVIDPDPGPGEGA